MGFLKVQCQLPVRTFDVGLRLYVYALHGYFVEIMYTAVFDFIVSGDWRLHGITSIWMFFIYGFGIFMIEKMHLRLRDKMPCLLRCMLYTLWIFFIEFVSGYCLQMFGMCPWDYSLMPLNFMRLITAAYIPLWFIASVVCEQLLIKSTLRLCVGPSFVGPEVVKKSDATE